MKAGSGRLACHSWSRSAIAERHVLEQEDVFVGCRYPRVLRSCTPDLRRVLGRNGANWSIAKTVSSLPD